MALIAPPAPHFVDSRLDDTWIDFAKGWEKELMKLVRYPGGYMRFLAATSLDCYKDGELVDTWLYARLRGD